MSMLSVMREEAARYCELIENPDQLTRAALAHELVAALSSLVSAAARLPDVEPSSVELPDAPSQEDTRERFAAVQHALGEWDAYWTSLGPSGDGADEAAMLPLSDDLVDVWRDVKRGLLALDAGCRVDDVLWEWRFAYWTHWGRHATEALRALHARVAENGGPGSSVPA